MPYTVLWNLQEWGQGTKAKDNGKTLCVKPKKVTTWNKEVRNKYRLTDTSNVDTKIRGTHTRTLED